MHYITTTLLLFLLLTSCAHYSKRDEVDVIRLAEEAAVKSGYKLEDYKEPKARFEITKKDRTWTVFFHGDKKPFDNFQVWVDDQTGNTKVVPGE